MHDPAARDRLVARGAAGITTTCGILALHRADLQRGRPMPVDHPRAAAAVRAPPDTPVIGLETGAELYYPVLGRNRDGDVLELGRATADLVIAGQALVAQAPGLSALVLESANLPPCRAALARATGLPIHDILTLIAGIFLGVSAAGQASRLPERLVSVGVLLLYATYVCDMRRRRSGQG